MTVEYLDLPPAEAIQHFRAKGARISFDWRDTAAESHLASFTAAKAMRFEILRELRGAVDRAQAEGLAFGSFLRDLRPRLQRLGWWGKREIIDPDTGEVVQIAIGPRRLRTIFETNLTTAAQRGHWERIERLKDSAPYLRYTAVLDARTRPAHRAWDGIILPVGHEFWRTHYPPNGWRCRCDVTQLSDDDLADEGWQVSPDPEIHTRPWVNRRSGRVHQVPTGIDPGWDHNVGLVDPVESMRTWAAERMSGAPPALAAQFTTFVAPEDHMIDGRRRRRELVGEVGDITTAAGATAFRAALIERLRHERGAGEVEPAIVAGSDMGPAREVLAAAAMLPRSWVERGNDVEIEVRRAEKRGGYRADSPLVAVSGALGSAVHEYTHHLQRTLGEPFNRIWREVHVRRTTNSAGERDPRVSVYSDHPDHDERGQPDDYVDGYSGRIYPETTTDALGMPAGDPLELATTHMEMVLGDHGAEDRLSDLAKEDPEMLDLVLGMLFNFDP